ncbi:MAG: NAD-dependent epimerase/dehydratase family protein, partial [Pseudonocardiaceae bacterium]
MRALVTGGAGFIGSHLVDRLLDNGHEVTVVDGFSTGKLVNLEPARLRFGDRLQIRALDVTSADLTSAVAQACPDAVLHLAAQIDVRRSVEDPVGDAMINVVGTVRLLEACRRHGVGKIVFTTSGGCIYGEPDPSELPIDETYPGHPHSPYGASKRGVEEYLHAYAALYGLRWSSLALANVFGPRQDPSGEAGVVSIFGGRMLRGQPVTIFGDGEQTRDFVYVDDVVQAFVLALDRGDGLRLNVGTGVATSVNALFHALSDVTGNGAKPQYSPERPGELRHIALDARLAGAQLGWKPQTGLCDGLEATVS